MEDTNTAPQNPEEKPGATANTNEESGSKSFPEHEKLRQIADMSQTLGEFLSWLPTKGLYLCVATGPEEFARWRYSEADISQILANFYNINLFVLEQEKEEMLAILREFHEQAVAEGNSDTADDEPGNDDGGNS